MSQLRLAYVNCKVVSRNTNVSSPSSKASPVDSSALPLVALKVATLYGRRPRAAAIVEKLVDDLLQELESTA